MDSLVWYIVFIYLCCENFILADKGKKNNNLCTYIYIYINNVKNVRCHKTVRSGKNILEGTEFHCCHEGQ